MYHTGTGVGTDYTGVNATITWKGATNSTWNTLFEHQGELVE